MKFSTRAEAIESFADSLPTEGVSNARCAVEPLESGVKISFISQAGGEFYRTQKTVYEFGFGSSPEVGTMEQYRDEELTGRSIITREAFEQDAFYGRMLQEISGALTESL